MVIMLDKLVAASENGDEVEIFLVGQTVPIYIKDTYDEFIAKLKGGKNE